MFIPQIYSTLEYHMYIRIKVIPGAKKELYKQTGDFTYEISVKEKAERNMANRRVMEILALHLGKKQSDFKLVSGHHTRTKMFSVKEAPDDHL